MAERKDFEGNVTSIAAMGRDELIQKIRYFRGRFKLDFTEEYLNSLTVDELRHILLRAMTKAKI